MTDPSASVFNDAYIAEQYENFRRDTGSVDESWRQFFRLAAMYGDGSAVPFASAASAAPAPPAPPPVRPPPALPILRPPQPASRTRTSRAGSSAFRAT